MNKQIIVAELPRQIAALRRGLMAAKEPEQVIQVGAATAGLEAALKSAGFYRPEHLRPVRELYLDARCSLGVMLRKMLRGQTGRPKKNEERSAPSFTAELLRLNLQKARAIECQRASYLPIGERRKVYAEAKQQEILPTMEWLIEEASPYWYKERREERHQKIATRAKVRIASDRLGPFPLIYADPPWTFETYTPKGHESHRMPEDHYPVMSDEEIAAFKIGKQSISDLAAKDAILFLWCTSSNIFRAIDIIESWGFTYKTHAIWDKMRIGTGLLFRNRHEVLLAGTRGDMPKPVKLFSSVFCHRRTKHSAKPPEIRQAIEQMYPYFDTPETKIELFARGQMEGWTCVGFEAAPTGSTRRGRRPAGMD
jgi:N6-adenosine-specific RNA methylase IME4